MYRVVAHRVRSGRGFPNREWKGYTVVSEPEIGFSMSLVTSDGRWLTTTPVRRVMKLGDATYVQTDNSTYRLVIDPRPVIAPDFVRS